MLTATEIEEWNMTTETRPPLTYESEAELRASRDKYMVACVKAERAAMGLLRALRAIVERVDEGPSGVAAQMVTARDQIAIKGSFLQLVEEGRTAIEAAREVGIDG